MPVDKPARAVIKNPNPISLTNFTVPSVFSPNNYLIIYAKVNYIHIMFVPVKYCFRRIRLYLIFIYASPLAPLQPVLPGTLDDFLAGEGSVIERGLRPLSELTSPFQTYKKSSMGNNPV
jgi:hypothetical protein